MRQSDQRTDGHQRGIERAGLGPATDTRERALLSGKSLLPAGVTSVDGRFERGDVVSVRAANGRELARGLVAYNADEAKRLIGRRTAEIENILGYRGRDEIIHRDDLAVTAIPTS